jgi:hypothetical protein
MLAGMKKNNTAIGAAVVAALVPSITGSAEDHRCSAIFDDGQRLACYDTAFGKPARPAVAVATAPALPQPVAPAPAATPPRVVPAAVASAPPVAAPAQPAKAKDAPFPAKVVAVGQLSNDRFAVTLDNGQLWMQIERDVGAEVRVGDTVTLRPAMLGSWILETRVGIRTRVRLAR